jgi:hypothetical protein
MANQSTSRPIDKYDSRQRNCDRRRDKILGDGIRYARFSEARKAIQMDGFEIPLAVFATLTKPLQHKTSQCEIILEAAFAAKDKCLGNGHVFVVMLHNKYLSRRMPY